MASDSGAARPASHGGEGGHLPAKEENIKLLSRLQLATTPDAITDVDEFKGYAYLGTDYAACPTDQGGEGTGTGVHVVDVRNPRVPKEVGFIETAARNGEGIHAFKVKTPKFSGDILLISNESCVAEDPHGGITIVDVSNPKNPKVLASEVGDLDPNDPTLEPYAEPNDVHSVMGWDAGDRAYAVMTDNFESGCLDVDIMDITNPRAPKLITETGLCDETFAAPIGPGSANGDEYLHHDMWVKKIAGHWHVMLSYWDIGWVDLNVDNPKRPKVLRDSEYTADDPMVPGFTPEGNGHQGSWSSSNKFFIGTDEDFAPFRIRTVSITTGPNAGNFPGAAVGGGAPPNSLADGVLNGPTVYGGYGCPADIYPGAHPVPKRADYTFTLAEGEEAILVMQRGPNGDPFEPNEVGGCFPGEKANEAFKAGWDAVLLADRHHGDAESDTPYCGSGGYPSDPPIVTACTTHTALHTIFNTTPSYEVPYDNDNNDEPQIGAQGEKVSTTGEYDGWGYAHLFDAKTLQSIDTYAPTETISEEFGSGFGTLSSHEVETDKRKGVNLAYFSWYAAGARVVKFGSSGLEEVGAYIHPDGNDFWGIDTIKQGDRRPILLLSDRHYGLYVLQYTGPE